MDFIWFEEEGGIPESAVRTLMAAEPTTIQFHMIEPVAPSADDLEMMFGGYCLRRLMTREEIKREYGPLVKKPPEDGGCSS